MDLANGFRHEQELHQRLLAGDVVASAEIAEQLLFAVIQQMRRRYPQLDEPHRVDEAVHDAFMTYFQHPERYNPEKSSLAAYLLMSAEGDLRNNLSRHPVPTLPLDTIEGELSLVDVEESSEPVQPWWVRWPWLSRQVPDSQDRLVLGLMLDQVRPTAAYVGILGIEQQSRAEQRAAVKRHKDRLRKRLRRLINPADLRMYG
jgi:DNA-directed RNA polymerase specialized sigma24 family protein